MEEPNFYARNGNGVHPLTLRDFVAIAFRHRRLMVLSFSGILLGAILAALLQPNRYEARMEILVKRERVDPVVTPEASAQAQPSPAVTAEELNSEVELLKSRDMLEKVVLACDLQKQALRDWSGVLGVISGHMAAGLQKRRPINYERSSNAGKQAGCGSGEQDEPNRSEL